MSTPFSLVTDHGQLHGLRDGWERLAEGRPRPFCRYAWHATAAATLCPDHGLRILDLGPHSAPLAIAPMAMSAGSRAGAWEILGSSVLYEPTELLYRDEDVLRDLRVRWAAHEATVRELLGPRLDELNRLLAEHGFGGIIRPEPRRRAIS